MPSVSKVEMSERLKNSWKFLSGSDLTFRELKSNIPTPDCRYMTVVIPIGIFEQKRSKAIAVGLQITEDQAMHVASNMFDLAREKLTEEDISDACKECCNVLGGGFSFDDANKLGVPTEISHERFLALQNDSSFTVSFSSNKPFDGHVILTVLFLTNNQLLNGI